MAVTKCKGRPGCEAGEKAAMARELGGWGGAGSKGASVFDHGRSSLGLGKAALEMSRRPELGGNVRASPGSVSVILSSDGTRMLQALGKAATFALLWGFLWSSGDR